MSAQCLCGGDLLIKHFTPMVRASWRITLSASRPFLNTEKQLHPSISSSQAKEWHLLSNDLRQTKEAIREQAFIGSAPVSCPFGHIVAIRRHKGQLLAMIRSLGRWYPVESVSIEYIGCQFLSPTTGSQYQSRPGHRIATSLPVRRTGHGHKVWAP